MKKEKLLPFLKGIAETIKAGIPWNDLGFVYLRDGSFPRGCVQVMSDPAEVGSKPEVIATFHTKGMSCSMPVSPRDFQLADLLIESIKYLQKLEREENNA